MTLLSSIFFLKDVWCCVFVVWCVMCVYVVCECMYGVCVHVCMLCVCAYVVCVVYVCVVCVCGVWYVCMCVMCVVCLWSMCVVCESMWCVHMVCVSVSCLCVCCVCKSEDIQRVDSLHCVCPENLALLTRPGIRFLYFLSQLSGPVLMFYLLNKPKLWLVTKEGRIKGIQTPFLCLCSNCVIAYVESTV